LLNVLTTLAVVLFSGVFLAADPGLYRRGLVMMFPRGWHEKITHGLNETGQALQLWLRAQLLTMTAVGTLVGLGTAAIGLPAPLALGLIAGITEFVPIVGPIIGAAPAVLVAVNDGPTLIWTVLLYVGVQQVEANLITPVLQRSIVSIPPVLLLLSFVALGGIFGSLGIVVAAPLTIAIFILVREFYIGDLLSERDQLSKLPLQKPARAKRRRTGRSAGKAPAEADDVTEP
jgi:predicted PurR-regulated permease PerM